MAAVEVCSAKRLPAMPRRRTHLHLVPAGLHLPAQLQLLPLLLQRQLLQLLPQLGQLVLLLPRPLIRGLADGHQC
jgi:hypothetical protein